MDYNYYKKGSYNVICDRCGVKYKRDDCRFEWQGYLVCYNCWDPKHPVLEPLPCPVDSIGVKDARPRPTPIFVDAGLSDMGIWGVRYKTHIGYVTNLKWEGWTGRWGGDGNTPFSGSNFPLE